MEGSIRIVKQLIRLARLLAAKDWTADIKRKRPDIDAEYVKAYLRAMNNPKREKIIMYWLLDRKSISLRHDGNIVEKALDILEREKNPDGTSLDYQQFKGPYDVLERKTTSANKIKKKLSFNPDAEPTFSNKKNLGGGITVYEVEDDFDGLLAVRRAIDVQLGEDSDPWCIASRNLEWLEDEPEDADYVPEDCLDLAYAWTQWQAHSDYPKRIALKNGRVHAFCASENGELEWWDLQDEPSERIPGTLVDDDPEFLEMYFPEVLEKNQSMSEMDSEDEKALHIALTGDTGDRKALARNRNTPKKALEALSYDDDHTVQAVLASNSSISPEAMEWLAKSEHVDVKDELLKNRKLTDKALEILCGDKNDYIRERAIGLSEKRK